MNINKLSYLRPYKNFGMCKLIRLKSFLLVCRFPIIVRNLKSIYDTSSHLIGRSYTNRLIKHMIGDLLTGGSTFPELEKVLVNVNKEGFFACVGYCMEFLEKQKEHDVERIIDVYMKTIDYAIKINPKNTISVKVSSLCDIENLKLYNKIQIILSLIDSLLKNDASLEEINKQINLVKKDVEVLLNEENIKFLMSKQSFLGLNLLEFFATFSKQELEDLNKIFIVDNKNFEYGKVFHSRLNKIFSYAKENKCSVLYDAEQSYIQKIIDSAAFYYASYLNKDFPTILETVQCYLKDSPQKMESFLNFYRENNLKLGFKIVRGAYLSEEIKLSNQFGYPKIIWNTIEDTHNNYNDIMRKLVSIYKEGDKIIFASHNWDSIVLLSDLIEGKNKIYQDIYAAQLFGISDHVTLLSKTKNLQTMRHLAYGDIDIMVPWFIRRVEETSIITKLKPQTILLNREILLRLEKPFLLISLFLLVFILYP